MTPKTQHPNPGHTSDSGPAGLSAPPHADKDRAKADQQHEEARRKALAGSQHKENTRSVAAPRYHGHRGG